MYTIYDYLKYYGDITIDQIKWNVQDNLICSLLSYLPFESFNKKYNLKDFYNYIENNKVKSLQSKSSQKSFDLLKKLLNVPRYNDLIIVNSEYILNNETQFGATTYNIAKNTIVSYRGSDDSMISWIENLKVAYTYPTITQNYAIKYLNKVKGTNIYVNGHSKGGNLAIVSAMECKSNIFNKIKRIDNFDGPGLRKEEYSAKKYKRIISKLNNYLPSDSFVGSLLYNSNYTYIKSNGIGIKVHYPYSWLLFGEEFIKQKASSFSSKINDITTNGVSKINRNDLQKTFDTIINYVIDNKKAKINFKEIYNIILNTKDIDKTTKDYLIKILTILGNELIKPKKEK